MRASNVKEDVFLTPITPSNVKPLTGVPCSLFYSFDSAAIQFLRSPGRGRGCVPEGEASALYTYSSTPVLGQSQKTTHDSQQAYVPTRQPHVPTPTSPRVTLTLILVLISSDSFVVESDLEHTHIAVQGHVYWSSSTHIYPYEHTHRLVCVRQMPTDAEMQEMGLAAKGCLVWAEALVLYAVMRPCCMWQYSLR